MWWFYLHNSFINYNITVAACQLFCAYVNISRYYPDLALSANTISTFLQKLGEDGAKRESFYKKRISLVEKTHHVAIDGTLKQDSSSVNDLSAFSRKARVKGCRDISVIYAYDLERMEPLCAVVFPGNSIDATS